MIIFAADNHFGAHPGRTLNECLRTSHKITFWEDDWSCLETNLADHCSLLILNMISGTSGVSEPGPLAEKQLHRYLENSGNLFLLHAASAAFWMWDWWRPLVGFRWVRDNDPDGFASSVHPIQACSLQLTKSRHPLCKSLKEFSLPTDEIYTGLEQTCPTITLMETTFAGKTYPMSYVCSTPWGGSVIGYLPGHDRSVVQMPENIHNCRVIIDFLAKK